MICNSSFGYISKIDKYLINLDRYLHLRKSSKTLPLALYQGEYNNSNSMYQKRMLV